MINEVFFWHHAQFSTDNSNEECVSMNISNILYCSDWNKSSEVTCLFGGNETAELQSMDRYYSRGEYSDPNRKYMPHIISLHILPPCNKTMLFSMNFMSFKTFIFLLVTMIFHLIVTAKWCHRKKYYVTYSMNSIKVRIRCWLFLCYCRITCKSIGHVMLFSILPPHKRCPCVVMSICNLKLLIKIFKGKNTYIDTHFSKAQLQFKWVQSFSCYANLMTTNIRHKIKMLIMVCFRSKTWL
jgi:hypothetical protein